VWRLYSIFPLFFANEYVFETFLGIEIGLELTKKHFFVKSEVFVNALKIDTIDLA